MPTEVLSSHEDPHEEPEVESDEDSDGDIWCAISPDDRVELDPGQLFGLQRGQQPISLSEYMSLPSPQRPQSTQRLLGLPSISLPTPLPLETHHVGVKCNFCEKSNIRGMRYKCVQCEGTSIPCKISSVSPFVAGTVVYIFDFTDHNLCSACMSSPGAWKAHDVTHRFFPINLPGELGDYMEVKGWMTKREVQTRAPNTQDGMEERWMEENSECYNGPPRYSRLTMIDR